MSESQAKEQKAIMASDVVEATVGEDLDEILARLCNLTEEAAVKEGKLKGTSAFKLSSLKKIAKQRGLVVGLAKPDMINRIRENVIKEKVLESIAEKERSGTYRHDKNTFPRLVNLVMRYPDALQRSSALATRMDLQNKTTNANNPIWVSVAEEFMDGTDSGGLVKNHEKFIKFDIDPEKVSSTGVFTHTQGFELWKELSRSYAVVKKRYEASGQHNGKDFLDFCGQLTHATQLEMLYLHESLLAAGNPELTAFCVEGNEIDGGLDTADGKSAPVGEVKKSRKRPQQDGQSEMIKIMQQRREDDQVSQVVNMRKDLNITLSLLSTTWQDLDKTVMILEEAPDFSTNEKKKARYVTYQLKIAEAEAEMQVIRRELQRMKPSLSAEDSLNTSTETNEISIMKENPVIDFYFDSDESFSSDKMPTQSSSSTLTLCFCGCSREVSQTSHFCSVTGKHVMSFCLIEGSEEGYGSRGICKGCASSA